MIGIVWVHNKFFKEAQELLAKAMNRTMVVAEGIRSEIVGLSSAVDHCPG